MHTQKDLIIVTCGLLLALFFFYKAHNISKEPFDAMVYKVDSGYMLNPATYTGGPQAGDFGRQGVTLNPLNIQVKPSDVGAGPEYQNPQDLCPSALNTPCNTRWDCPGKAELCMNSAGYPANGEDSKNNYCVCNIANDCIFEGVC